MGCETRQTRQHHRTPLQGIRLAPLPGLSGYLSFSLAHRQQPHTQLSFKRSLGTSEKRHAPHAAGPEKAPKAMIEVKEDKAAAKKRRKKKKRRKAQAEGATHTRSHTMNLIYVYIPIEAV